MVVDSLALAQVKLSPVREVQSKISLSIVTTKLEAGNLEPSPVVTAKVTGSVELSIPPTVAIFETALFFT